MWKKQLAALNLALLLLVSAAVPALAAEEGRAASYPILVDGVRFNADESASGDGWQYDPNGGLSLEGYHGGAISASGDLAVYVRGDTTITAADGGDYADSGIWTTGSLSLTLWGGSLTVRGGDGYIRPGDAIFSNSEFVFSSYSNGRVELYGGDLLSTSFSEPLTAGMGIFAPTVTLSGYGDSTLTIQGGDAPTDRSGREGGAGILANVVIVSTDCTIRGGTGYLGGIGIIFDSMCEFDAVNANIIGGEAEPLAIWGRREESSSLYYSRHTFVTGENTSASGISVRVKDYTLTLDGDGGTTPDGATSISLTAPYGTGYSMDRYSFRKEGCVQVAWTGEGCPMDDPLALNAYYVPTTPCTLNAYWIQAGPGDVVLNALEGRLEDGSFYQKTTGPTVLPDEVRYEREGQHLLGWNTEISSRIDEDTGLYGGQWYAGGSTAEPGGDGPLALYAQQAYGGGQYALYYPTEGALKAGGTMLVQGYVSTATDMYVYTPGEEALTPPEGFAFAGWSRTEDGTEPEVAAGDPLVLPGYNQEPLRLYAVWEPLAGHYQPEEGLTVIDLAGSGTVEVSASPGWLAEASPGARLCAALYSPEGKLLEYRSAPWTGEGAALELPRPGTGELQCRIFAVDEDLRPLRPPAQCSLTP